jgi:hypothetical protein
LSLNIGTHLFTQFLKLALPLPSILNLKRLNHSLAINNWLSTHPAYFGVNLQFDRTRSWTIILNVLFLRLISRVNCILNNLIPCGRCVTLLDIIWSLELSVTCIALFSLLIFLGNNYLAFTLSNLFFRQTHICLILNILKTDNIILFLRITILLTILISLHRFILTKLFIRQNESTWFESFPDLNW